jgi:formamidopyrimidine-DNA glycosylase
MPELPEVETVRRGLDEVAVSNRIERVLVTGRRTVRRQTIAQFEADVTGRTMVAARRRGKYLLVDLDDGAVLVIHLRMSGQLLVVDPTEAVVVHTHVRLELSNGRELRFVDPRTFGELFVTEDLDDRRVPLVLSSLGTDPIVDGFEPDVLIALLHGRKVALKAFLLDQHKVCGIGNIYADEICFAAKLSPLRRTETLKKADVVRLAGAVGTVLNEAIAASGSSLRDARYRDLMGGLGSYQERHATYDRAGLPCLTCGRAIVRSKIVGRSTYFCPRCQK